MAELLSTESVLLGRRFSLQAFPALKDFGFTPLAYPFTVVVEIWIQALKFIGLYVGFLKNYLSPHILSLTVETQGEDQENWCYAAVAAGVAKYYDPSSSWKVCEIASMANAGLDCCADPKQCPNAKTVYDLLPKIGVDTKTIQGPITYSEIVKQIDLARPIIALHSYATDHPLSQESCRPGFLTPGGLRR